MAENIDFLQNSLARLIVESAFAGAQYDLREDTDIIRLSLSEWLECPDDVLRSEVVILMSSCRYDEAAALLSGASMDDCVALHQLLKKQDNYNDPYISE